MVIKKGDISNLEGIVQFIQNNMTEVPEILQRQYQMLYGNIEMVKARVGQDMEHMLSAWENETCIGVLSSIASPKQAENLKSESIIYLFVDKSHRDRHIAGSLLDYFVKDIDVNTKISTTLPFMEKRMACLFITRNFKSEGYINNGDEKYDNILLGRLI